MLRVLSRGPAPLGQPVLQGLKAITGFGRSCSRLAGEEPAGRVDVVPRGPHEACFWPFRWRPGVVSQPGPVSRLAGFLESGCCEVILCHGFVEEASGFLGVRCGSFDKLVHTFVVPGRIGETVSCIEQALRVVHALVSSIDPPRACRCGVAFAAVRFETVGALVEPTADHLGCFTAVTGRRENTVCAIGVAETVTDRLRAGERPEDVAAAGAGLEPPGGAPSGVECLARVRVGMDGPLLVR